jgi:ATP-dependent DNA helicase RecG
VLEKTTQKLSVSEVRGLLKLYTLPDLDERLVDDGIFQKMQFNDSLLGRFKKKSNFSLKEGKTKGVTYGVYLCFVAKNTQFYNAIVRAARFKGLTPVEFIDEKQFDGPLLLIPDEIMAFIRRHINKQIIISGKATHDEVWDYPLEALREAIMNALVHRDYSDSGNVQIRIFDDRVEIWSPGLLPKEVDISEIYKQARSVPRNKLIIRIFHEINLIENWGTGFQRMLKLCRENGNPDPEFSNRAGAFVASFKKRKENVPENVPENRASLICKLMKKDSTISALELAKKIGANEKTIKRAIDKLKREGIIRRIGPDKGGHWKVLKF